MRTLWRLIASFFKWTWRILNFIRKLALNAIFLVLGAGVYRYLEPVQQPTTSEHASARACCWILPAWWWINLPPAASSA